MNIQRKINLFGIGLLFASIFTAVYTLPVLAQNEDQLRLSMARDWGYGFGGDIQGLFSLHVEGPEDLERVIFYIDGQVMGEDIQPPFKLQFSTEHHSLGPHILSATGYTVRGLELHSNDIQRNFVTEAEGNRVALWIIVPVFGLAFGVIALSLLLAVVQKPAAVPLGARRVYGVSGGAVCKNCLRPFSIRMLALNFGARSLDRCPHCGRWAMHRPLPLSELRAAEAAELDQAGGQPEFAEQSEAERIRKSLDDSRYL